jgi:hypothetical protein
MKEINKKILRSDGEIRRDRTGNEIFTEAGIRYLLTESEDI